MIYVFKSPKEKNSSKGFTVLCSLSTTLFDFEISKIKAINVLKDMEMSICLKAVNKQHAIVDKKLCSSEAGLK